MARRARRVVIVAALFIAAAAIVGFGGLGLRHETRTSRGNEPERASGRTVSGGRLRTDSLRRDAAISGKVTDGRGRAISGARICANAVNDQLARRLTKEPSCTVTGLTGTYAISHLLAAKYGVTAMARTFRPAYFHPTAEVDELFALADAEHRTGVDLVLGDGGVEVTGTISDVSGGPIARASVRAASRREVSGSTIETDEAGHYSLWVSPGDVTIVASADGYLTHDDEGNAPGVVDLALLPAASISGTVIDSQTNAPVAGIAVNVTTSFFVDWDGPPGDVTDENGRFRIEGLAPIRFKVVARARNLIGMSAESVRAALGQQIDGAVVRVFPAAHLEGRVLVAGDPTRACRNARVLLTPRGAEESLLGETDPDGTIHVDAVLPGTYIPTITCDRYRARAEYPPIEVSDKDVVGLTWQVDEGGTVRGRVLDPSGAPVSGADVSTTGNAFATSRSDGTYELAGLAEGKAHLVVISSQGFGPAEGDDVQVHVGQVVQRDLHLVSGGSIKGMVVDTAGRSIGGVQIWAHGLDGPDAPGQDRVISAADGTFEIRLPAGSYQLDLAMKGFTGEPGGDEARRVRVPPAGTATVRLVLQRCGGVIRGTVRDAVGNPAGDAFIAVALESKSQEEVVEFTRGTSRWPVSHVDGAFAISDLPPGEYTVRAFHEGGDEAVASHVAVGATIDLQLVSTGALEGSVRVDGKPPQDFNVQLVATKGGTIRYERFVHTDGRYAVRELPPGSYSVDVQLGDHDAKRDVEVASGKTVRDVDFQFDASVTVSGRIVDVRSRQPLPGIEIYAGTARKGATDSAGRFALALDPGQATLQMMPSNDYGSISIRVMLAAKHDLDLGDIGMAKLRVPDDSKAGTLGIIWKSYPDDVPSAQRVLEVGAIDPSGPASRTVLAVGDIVTAIDGTSITGLDRLAGWTLLDVAPGTRIVLGLARGVDVELVAARK